ncbi:MAG: hypothetical protein ABW116_13320, partial [Candidatus Sedimenticola sp. 20ELBAFRAG]
MAITILVDTVSHDLHCTRVYGRIVVITVKVCCMAVIIGIHRNDRLFMFDRYARFTFRPKHSHGIGN